jgi:formate hydrogenlyase subunit 6/NADH:ubiquinone oxidoreductase subunit I
MKVFKVVLKQLFLNAATNKFPAKYAPASTIKFLEKVSKGKLKMVPPIAVPPNFLGKIAYNREKCIGCQLCIKVCPAKAIEFLPEAKKIRIFVARCSFCAQCNDICPVKVLSMTDEFMLSNDNKYADELVVTK